MYNPTTILSQSHPYHSMPSELPVHRNDASEQQPGFFQLHRSQAREPVDNKRKLALLISYAPDWILTIVVAGLFFLLDNVHGFKREFSLDDTSIQHSFAIHERIPNSDLFLISVIAPLVLMAIVNVISIRSFWDLHTSWLGVILGLALTGSVTNVVKVTVGRPRPDCIDRCQPLPGSANPVFGLVNSTICTQIDNAILEDGFRSFPSGHSSLSFAGLGFVSFYLAGKLHLFDERGHTAKAWISIVPLLGAVLVAVSRTMDYRHHWQDVLVGSLLGFLLAWFSYRQYYPPLSHPLSHRPFSPRVSRIRPPLSNMHGNHNAANDTEHQPLNRTSHPSSQYEEMELQGTTRNGVVNHDTVDLRNLWKQGDGEHISPPGEEQQRPRRLADERV